jgi:hypothetical protein
MQPVRLALLNPRRCYGSPIRSVVKASASRHRYGFSRCASGASVVLAFRGASRASSARKTMRTFWYDKQHDHSGRTEGVRNRARAA